MTFPGIEADTSGQADSGAAEKSGGKGAEERIGQLVRQRNEAQRQAQADRQELAALRDEVRGLKDTFGQKSQDDLKPASFEDLPVDQLKGQLAEALSNNEGALAAELQFEMQRRLAQSASSRSADQLRDEHRQSQWTSSLRQEIQTRFADVMADPHGDTYGKAQLYANAFQQNVGSGWNDNPVYELTAFALASLDASKAAHATEVETLKNEIASLREGQGLQTGLREAVALNDESAAALKKGDIQGAFRNLGVFKSLDG